ncbi:protein kinase domain-containing protein [Nocardia sp. NPDC004722]
MPRLFGIASTTGLDRVEPSAWSGAGGEEVQTRRVSRAGLSRVGSRCHPSVLMSGSLVFGMRRVIVRMLWGGMVALQVGAMIAEYKILQRIGDGVLGAVYLARHSRTERTVALKVLHRLPDDFAARAAFERAAELFSSLDHPNIVPVYDRNGPRDGYLWYAMRDIDGGDLGALLRGSPGGVDPDRAIRLITSAAQALDHAHEAGVPHGDVKPASILVENDDDGERAVLADFGIARALEDFGIAADADVNFAYMAPERFTRAIEIDRRADVYALGCTAFELLTGRPPYPFPGVVACFAHINTPPPSPRAWRPDLPVRLDAVIARALAKDPADRFPTCAEFASAFARALSTDTYAPRPAAPDTSESGEPSDEIWQLPVVSGGRAAALTNFGVMLEQRGASGVALACYLRAADAGYLDAIYRVGLLQHHQGALAEAEDWYRCAVDRGYLGGLVGLGNLMKQQGRLAEAETCYRRGADNENDAAMNNLAVVLEERGELAEAETWYRRAAEAGNSTGMISFGCLLHKRGEFTEAEHWYRRAAEQNHPLAATNLEILSRQRGAAAADDQTGPDQDIDDEDAGAQVARAKLLKQRGDSAGAEKWFRRAADGDDSEGMYNLGLLLQARGEAAEAEAWYRAAADQDHALAMARLAFLLRRRGELDEAEHWYRRAIDHGNDAAVVGLTVLLEQRRRPAPPDSRPDTGEGSVVTTKHLTNLHNLG